MGLGQTDKKIYLQIGYGRLRKKVTAPAEGVVERITEDGKKSYAYEYTYVEGLITDIFYKEDKEYGNSFNVTMKDIENVYCVVFKENSRYCQDFLSKLPRINLSKPVKITPYQMLGDNNKEIRGVSIQQEGVKLLNYFVAKEGEKRIYNAGYPEPKAEKLTEKQWKIYLIEIQDFLTQYAAKEIIPKLKNIKSVKPEIESEQAEDDLPF